MNETAGVRQCAATDLEALYGEALQEFLAAPGEAPLRRAYELGRSALARGFGVLDMAMLHHSVLAKVLARERDSDQAERVLRAAGQFYAESLSPYEMAHRGFRDAIAALHRLNETLEQEVKRIAHAVHDEAGQLLVVARLAMSEVARDLPPSGQGQLNEVTAILGQIEEQLRRLSHELRPTILDDLGLVPAVQFLAEGLSKRARLPIRVEASVEGRLSASVETVLYRVIHEALTNVTKHSHAKNVRIQLQRGTRSLCCSVQDDGVGFDVPTVLSGKEPRGLGLVGIRERLNPLGGTLRINSVPGQGTQLLITIPMEDKDANSSSAG